MSDRRHLRVIPLAAAMSFVLMVGTACQPASDQSSSERSTAEQPAPGQPMLLPVDPTALLVETAAGEQRFRIEVADDNIERSRGLMYRRTMPDDRGMLFVFEDTRRVSFWMKDTPMPLDLVFIGEDGVVRAIMNGVPFSEAPIGPAAPVRFVLELKAGTAQKAGIAEGDRMRHPRIDEIAGAN